MKDISEKSEDEQAQFYRNSLALSEKALEETGCITFTLHIAGTTIRLNFAGPAMVDDLMPAIAHLVCGDNGQEDVVFNIWDSRSTGVEMERPPVHNNHLTRRGDIWGFGSERYKAAFHWGDYSVNLFDRESKIGVYWVEESGQLPYWLKGSPLRTLFHWWMEMNNCQLLHAAAVGNSEGAVLITGSSGVGKSSSALACLSSGMKYISDDYLIVELGDNPVAHSLYSTAKLNADQVERFASLRQYITNLDTMKDEKATLYLYPDLKHQIIKSLPLKAIVTPQFGEEEASQIVPISRDHLISAAALTTMSQLPCVTEGNYQRIVEMVEALPGFALKLGSSREGVAKKLSEFVEMDREAIQMLEKQRSDDTAQAQPLISVIIPVYNGLKFLNDAIQSVLSQDYAVLEIIIVDDGSSEDIETAAANLSVDVQFFRQDNQGPAAARNRGIKEAAGQYIAFLDVDDLWPDRTLHSLLEVHRESPDLDVVHGHAQVMTLSEETDRYSFTGNPEEAFPYYIGAGLYRREAFEKNGLFDEDLTFAEDSDWYKRAEEIDLAILRYTGVTLHVRRHGANMTAGRTEAELNPLLAFKKALDRRRAREKIEAEGQ